jgi:hypothetical protein
VSDDSDLERVERMLQRTPAPEFVPATAAAVARRAALGEAAPVIRAPRVWRWPAWWRVASVSAAFGAALAVAVVLAVGGRGGGFATQYALSLSGPHGATAEVDFGHASNGVRQMVVHVHGLPPAGAGRYYEMWFRTGGNDNVSAVTFDTAAGGEATFKAVIPAGMSWRNCWVMRETIGGKESPGMVLST